MSFDISLWKWNTNKHISPILCSLLLDEGIPVDCLTELDITTLSNEIEKKFPGVFCETESSFEIEIQKFSISCSFYPSTPESTLYWFEEFAERNDLFLFIPQDGNNKDYKKAKNEFDKIYKQYKNEALENEEIPALLHEIENGNSDACVSLGNYYYFGELIKNDFTKAFEYYKKAADLGNDEGKFNVASCFRNGEGVGKNLAKAIETYLELVDKDPMFSGFELGSIYLEEKEYRNLDKAKQYFDLSAKAGNQKSACKLKSMIDINEKNRSE
jgi:TPR repeat protein